MNESSSYKHLTVILASLLTTIVIAIIVLILLLTSTDFEDVPQTDPSQTSAQAIVPNTTLSQTSEVPSTDTPTAPITTNGTPTDDSTVTQSPVTTAPPVTDPPPAVDTPIGPINGYAYGDALGSLGLYAEWSTVSYDEETGSCTLKLDFYCESFSITIGQRFANYLVINDQRVEFRTEKVSVPTNDFKARTLLYSTEYEVQKDALTERFDVHVEFGWHYQGSYSGEHAEWLTLTTDFVV